ncbi:MAG: trypsin-like peptidase domain-containing protein [Ruminococcus flavefaciens]|nr:trypsin-like peptidase domain-containing protein [Ruminococcus flavefaciens]MCM1061311.1 trypsin-like peptidase domain-containing protein [Eubacterium sp.]
MKVKSRMIAFLSTAMVAAASVMSFSGSAAQNVVYNDPSGDGKIDMSDAVAVMQYLSGAITPENVDKLDFDNNGVVTPMDAYKIQAYKLELLEKEKPLGVYGSPKAETFVADETSRSYLVYNAQTKSYMRRYSLSVSAEYPNQHSNPNNEISTYSVMPDDDREVDWSKSGTVKLMTPYGYNGTGFVVNPHVIATCAHCVYRGDDKTLYNISNIKLFDNEGNVSLNATPKEIHIPAKYYDSANYEPHYDYALITVQEDLSDYMCYDLGVALDSSFADESKRNNLPIYITGFAQESNVGGNSNSINNLITGIGKLYAKDKIENSNILPYQIVSDTAMSNGDSGGPVYITESYSDKYGNNAEYNTVIGINSSGAWRYSAATRITTDLLVFYKQNHNLKWE